MLFIMEVRLNLRDLYNDEGKYRFLNVYAPLYTIQRCPFMKVKKGLVPKRGEACNEDLILTFLPPYQINSRVSAVYNYYILIDFLNPS